MRTFNVEGAAEFLNISTDTMRRLAASGAVPGAKIGKAWVFIDVCLEWYLSKEIERQTAERQNRSGIMVANPAITPAAVPTAFTRTVRRASMAPPPLQLLPLLPLLPAPTKKRGRPARKIPSLDF